MPAKLLIRNRVDAIGLEYDGTFDPATPPPAAHPLMRSLLASRSAPSSILPRRSASKRARLLRPAFDEDSENLEAVLLVLVNSEDDVQTLKCMRRTNTDDVVGGQAVQMAELIAAGYALVGLLVLPPKDRIEDYMDASGVLRCPAETWDSCRSIEESKGFIGQVAEALVPASYHLRRVPEQVSSGDSKSSFGRTSPRG